MDQLTKHIQLVHSKSGQYKTILYSEKPHLYNVVTRVNYNTVLLWIDYVNSIIKSRPELNLDPLKGINWMIMLKSYRREFIKKLNQ